MRRFRTVAKYKNNLQKSCSNKQTIVNFTTLKKRGQGRILFTPCRKTKQPRLDLMRNLNFEDLNFKDRT